MSEETRTMQTADTAPTRAPEDAPALVKKIGKLMISGNRLNSGCRFNSIGNRTKDVTGEKICLS